MLALENVSNSDALQICPTETETIALDAGLLASAEAGELFGKFVLPNGTLPTASTDTSLGIVYATGEVAASPDLLATIVISGRHWAMVQAGATLLDNAELAVDANGDVFTAVAGDVVMGRARNASAGSTANNRHYTTVQLGTPYVKA